MPLTQGQIITKQTTARLVGLIVLIILMAVTGLLYIQAKNDLTLSLQHQAEFFKLNNELKHSSDNLTRMARSYVITGKPHYRTYYQILIDIRDGKRAVSMSHNEDYWQPHPNLIHQAAKAAPGPSLLERLRQAGFSASEMDTVTQAKQLSDQLVQVELKAMNMIKTPIDPQIQKQALELLYSEDYDAQKVKIMQWLDRFNAMADQRIRNVILHAQQQQNQLGNLWIVWIICLTLFLLHQIMRYRNAKKEQRLKVKLHQAHKALDDSLQRLQTLEKLSPMAIWVVDTDKQNNRYINPYFFELFGYTQNDLPDMETWWQKAYPDPTYRQTIQKQWQDWIAHLSRQGRSEQALQTRVTCKDGQEKYILWACHFLENEHWMFGEDITSLKQMEHKLKENEKLLQLLIEYAPVSIAMFDQNMNYLAASRCWREVYDLKENIIGQCHYDVFPEISDEWKNFHQRALAGEVIHAEEDPFVRPDGSTYWLHWEIRPWKQSDQSIGGIAVFIENITPQVLARKKMESLNTELEYRVEERTKRLTERTLELHKHKFQHIAERLKILLENASDGIFVLDKQGKITEFSDSFLKMTGYSADEILALYIYDWDTCVSEKSMLQFLASFSETSTTFESCYRCKDNTLIDVEVNVKHIHINHELYLFGSARNISERKQTERLLKESEIRFIQAQHIAHLGSWQLNIPLNQLYWSEEVYRIFELNPNIFQPDYETFIDLIHPDDRNKVREVYADSLLEKQPYEIEHRLLMADGRIKYVIERGESTFDNNGFPLYSIGTILDITERKTIELALTDHKERLELAASAGTIGIWDWDLKTNILHWDSTMYHLYGIREKHFSHNVSYTYDTWLNSLHPSDRVRTEWDLINALKQRKNFIAEYRVIWPDGTLHYIKSAAKAAYNDQGEPVRMAGINYDVTELKLANQTLVKAKKQAEQASQAKSNFLATMSHEIRTPLNAIIGNSYLLKSSRLNQVQQEEVNAIEVSSKNLMVLINDILDLSKIEAGELELDYHRFSLAELLSDLKVMFSAMASNKGLQFNIINLIDSVPDILVSDSNRLRQMLINLLNNALKFTLEGQVILELKQSDRLAENKMLWLIFNVKDTGIGIADEMQNKLFQPFIQAENNTSKRFGGTGLGLSIVKKLTICMGGNISLKSNLGAGSEFILELPFQISDETTPLHTEYEIPRPLNILIVDDNPSDREVLLNIAQRFGWYAQAVENGQSMIDHVLQSLNNQTPVDCVLLDWQMPQLDGLSALNQLQKKVGNQIMPSVIMVTIEDLEKLQSQITETKPDHILTKPVQASTLFNSVNEAVVSHGQSLDHGVNSTLVGGENCEWLNGMRVLVVDDSRMNLDVIQRILSNEGATIRTSEFGTEAIDFLKNAANSFDIILMDLQMPEMDGYETTRIIRHELKLTEIPVIALTAGATVTERQKAMASGMNDFLTKPVEPRQLIRTLRRHFETYRGAPLPIIAKKSLSESSDPLNNEWPQIEGINKKDVYDRMGGDLTLFIQSLQRFFNEFESYCQVPAIPADSQARQALAAHIHKLAGNAGLIGAQGIFKLAKTIEQSLKSNTNTDEQLNLSFSELANAMQQLGAHTQSYRTIQNNETPIVDAPMDYALLESFHQQLKKRKVTCLQIYQELKPALHGVLSETDFENLDQAINNLNFEKVLAIMETILPNS